MRSFGITAPLCLAALLSACTLLPQQQQQQEKQKAEEEAPTLPPPLHLGAVHQVYPEQRFALLRMIGPVPVPGTTLITHPADGSNDRVGNLCVSNATSTRHGIIAADIRSGTVVKGDRVFRYREIAPPDPKEQEEEYQEDDTQATEADGTGDDTVLTQDDTPIIPDAAPEPQQVDTTVLPEEPTPAIPAPNPDTVPDSIRDVPDSIDDWNNL